MTRLAESAPGYGSHGPLLAVLLAVMPSASSAGEPAPSRSASAPIVIAHRGASGYRPEHTLAAYELAIEMGADFIEPDLVLTKDGVFIARHENALAIVEAGTGRMVEATTNVHVLAQFATRRATKQVDGKTLTGWFSEDFTAAEIKTLRARERIPHERPGNVAYNDRYEIPTLQEVIDLAKAKSAALGRVIGIYPETKHPSYHRSIGLPMEDRLVAVLRANGWDDALAPVFIQSFEVDNLRYLNTITKVRLVQLLDAAGAPWDFVARGNPKRYADLATADGLREIARYARGIGPNKRLVVQYDSKGSQARPTALVSDAHAAGLLVHPWTFRAENAFLPAGLRDGEERARHGDLRSEIRAYLEAGIDGFFTDHADLGVAARVAAKTPTR